MEKQTFTQLKAKLLEEMHKGNHCTASIQAVEQCQTLEQLARVLKLFFEQLKSKDFPTTDFLRQWFDKQELQQFGIFLDCTAEIKIDKGGSYFVLGNSEVTAMSDTIPLKHFICRDEARLHIVAKQFSLWHATLRNNAALNVIEKDRYARINITDKRNEK